MDISKEDIVREALVTINHVAPEQVPSAGDRETAMNRYDRFYQWMRKEFPRDMHWGPNTIDERYWTLVSDWFAGKLCRVMRCSVPDRVRVDELAAQSERELREMFARRPVKTTEAEYY